MEHNELMVTIRCLTYNHEPYIRQCLDGFVMQKTNFRFEAIVHDDASTDGTAAIVREYAEKYPDIIKPIFETENQYSKKDGSIRRIMNEHTHGKYIAMCEGDDYWIDPLKLQKQVDFLEANPEYGMCFTDFNAYYESKKIMCKSFYQTNKIRCNYRAVDDWIKEKGYTAPMTWVGKTDLFKSVPNLPSVDGTFVYYTHFLATSKTACLINEVTAVYRILEESASHSNSKETLYRREKGLFEIQLRLIKLYENKIDNPNKLHEAITNYYYRSNIRTFVELNKLDDIRIARSIIKPSNLKQTIVFFASRTIITWFFFRFLHSFCPSNEELDYWERFIDSTN